MDECSKCGVSEEVAKLHHAISSHGIIKICDKCQKSENIPIIRKPEPVAEQPRVSVRERLSILSKSRVNSREPTLRDLIDKQFQARKSQDNTSDLIDNFHWTIQKVRKVRRITRSQFAEGINEPESKVQMIEQGHLPENDYKIINKIEQYLGISLRKPGTSGFPNTDVKSYSIKRDLAEPPRKEEFENKAVKQIKITNLKESKEEPKKEKKSFVEKLFGFRKKEAEEDDLLEEELLREDANSDKDLFEEHEE